MDNQLQLASLATEINILHDSAQKAAMTVVEYAARCGEKLIEAKASCKHGEFQGWIANNCNIKYRQAAKYMTLASGMPQLSNSKSALEGTFDINTAIAYLSAPEEVKEIVDESPDTATEKQIRQLIKDKKEVEKRAEEWRVQWKKERDEKREIKAQKEELEGEPVIKVVAPADYESTKAAATDLARDLAIAKASEEAAAKEADQLNQELTNLQRKKKSDIEKGVTKGLEAYDETLQKKQKDIDRLEAKREEARQKYIEASKRATAAEMRNNRLISAKDHLFAVSADIYDAFDGLEQLTTEEFQAWKKVAKTMRDGADLLDTVLKPKVAA